MVRWILLACGLEACAPRLPPATLVRSSGRVGATGRPFGSATLKAFDWAHDAASVAFGWTQYCPHSPQGANMSKGKHGNKEAKKPKKVHVPNPPGLPPGLAPSLASTLRPKRG
jgi:hypothetical protein